MKLRPWTLPSNYIGESWDGFLIAPVTRHRDSDTLEESNFAAQRKILDAIDHSTWGFDEPPFHVVTENHWAVSWVEWVAIHPHAEQARAAMEKLADRLDQYPIADEDGYSQLEMDRAAETWKHLNVKDRVTALQRAKWHGSVLVARRAELPSGDSDYSLEEVLTRN